MRGFWWRGGGLLASGEWGGSRGGWWMRCGMGKERRGKNG